MAISERSHMRLDAAHAAQFVNPRQRKLSKADKLAINRVAQHNMIQEIQELEVRAHDLGMTVTASALNNAKNALGWELAGNVLKAAKAKRGER